MSDILNYQFQDPMQTFLKMSQFGNGIAQQRAAGMTAQFQAQEAEAKLAMARAKAEADAARQAEIDKLMEKLRQPGATLNDYLQLAMYMPKDQAKAIQDSVSQMREEEKAAALNESAQIFSAFKAGRPDIAVQYIRRQAEAERAAGNELGAKTAEQWAEMAESGEDGANAVMHMFGYQLTALPGGKDAMEAAIKLDEERRAAAAEPDAIRQRLANIGLTEAQTNKVNVEARKLGLDADKLAADIERQKNELPPGKTLSAPAEKLVNDAVMASAKAKALNVQYTTLAADFEKAITTAGVGARVSEMIKKTLGTEAEPTALRQEYLRLRNTAVLEMLPPGVASDKDIEIAMAAFPTETSSPANIAQFLRGMAKLQAYESASMGAQAEWIQQNGTLGTATGKMTVAGKAVTPGTRFQDFVAQFIPNTSVLGTMAAPAPAAATTTETVDY